MGDYGIKIAKPGYDVATAGDPDLIFSSSWPSLPIAFEYSTEAFSGLGAGVVPHGLGFAPFTLAWTRIGNKTYMCMPNVNETNVSLSTSYPNPTTYGYVHIKCYNLNLATDVEYPVLRAATTTVGSVGNDYGIKVSRSGYDAKVETDLRRFIIHSRAQSPLVLAVKTFTPTPAGGTLSYTSPLGYVSWVFGYAKLSLGPLAGYYVYAPFFSQAYPKTSVNDVTQNYSILVAANDAATLVMLRDPMFVATDVTAGY